MIKNDPSKPKLMILRNFCFFSENFLKNFPILRWSRHFQRDETRDARESEGGEWYQIVRWPKAFNSSYNRHLRVEALTSGGQFSEKKSEKLRPQVAKIFSKIFS